MNINNRSDNLDTAIILAAGQGKRMGSLTENTPKCLLKYKDVSFIKRLLSQLTSCGIKDIVVVVGYLKDKIVDEIKNFKGANIKIVINERYQEDQNIYSLNLALKEIVEPFLLVEADIIMEDDCVSYIVGDEFGTQSVWFTRGKFSSTQYGGILKSDVDKKIIDIRVVPKYQEEFSEYKKLTGLMRVGKNEIDYFKDLISRYCKTTLNQYYLRAWIENLTRLPAIESDISAFEFATFNSPEDYDALLKSDILSEQYSNDRVELIEVKKLKHIEGHSSARVELIKDRICAAGFWLRPIYVEKNYFLVLDGQHRMEAAKLLGLKYIPAQLFDYNEVEVWSLRAEEAVARDIVIERARSGDIYPYKTVKHRFENQVTKIKFSLNDLKV